MLSGEWGLAGFLSGEGGRCCTKLGAMVEYEGRGQGTTFKRRHSPRT